MVKHFLLGFAACLLLVGCAGFAYHYYGLEGVTYTNGKLLGPKPQDDLPFSNCEPTAQDKHPCVVMFAKDFFAFKLDYEDTQQKLKECQQGGKNEAATISIPTSLGASAR